MKKIKNLLIMTFLTTLCITTLSSQTSFAYVLYPAKQANPNIHYVWDNNSTIEGIPGITVTATYKAKYKKGQGAWINAKGSSSLSSSFNFTECKKESDIPKSSTINKYGLYNKEASWWSGTKYGQTQLKAAVNKPDLLYSAIVRVNKLECDKVNYNYVHGVIQHEIGHQLGLAHFTTDSRYDNVMEAGATFEKVFTLNKDEADAVISLYPFTWNGPMRAK